MVAHSSDVTYCLILACKKTEIRNKQFRKGQTRAITKDTFGYTRGPI